MSLAIVIPAYKPNYLKETLDSFAAQTNKSFTVYIGDDCSPSDLYSIIEPYFTTLNIVYHRFERNMGSQSLVKQWERCIDLVKDEEWIWLFSDDDIADTNCVEVFFLELLSSSASTSLYRFNNRIINSTSQEIRFNEATDAPKLLSVKDFLRSKFTFQLNSFACEYIFLKSKYQEVGGFIDFPLGWCSDDSMWCLMGKENGICTIQGPKVSWRLSGFNISSSKSTFEEEKIQAIIQFFEWVKKTFGKNFLFEKEIKVSSKRFLFNNIQNFRTTLTTIQLLRTTSLVSSVYDQSKLYTFIELALLNIKIYVRR